MKKWLALAALIALFDQGTKHLAGAMLDEHVPVPVMPFVYFTLTHNPGAAFSFLSDAGGWQRWVFSALSIAVSFFIVAWLRGIPRGEVWLPAALALVLGGAIGNLWDRLWLGAVVDFVQVYLPFLPWRIFNPWPTFNLADSAISIGAVMLFVSLFRDGGSGTRDPEPKSGA